METNNNENLLKLSEETIAKMKHCVGLDENSNIKKLRTRLFYKPYRNYYDAGGKDIECWKKLVEQKLAEKNEYYKLTIKGLEALSEITGIYIYSENARCVADAKPYVLYYVTLEYIAHKKGSWLPNSAKYISDALRIPIGIVQKSLHELSEDGYTKRVRSATNRYPNIGYFPTNKVETISYYKTLETDFK